MNPPRLGHNNYCNIIDLSIYKEHRPIKVLRICSPIVLIHFERPKEDNHSTKDTAAELILSPMCPLFGGSTVHVYIKFLPCTSMYIWGAPREAINNIAPVKVDNFACS